MAVLEKYVTPTKEELADMDVERAQTLDSVNLEILKRNRVLVVRSRDVLLDIDPSNRKLKQIGDENLKRPPNLTEAVKKIIAEKEAGE